MSGSTRLNNINSSMGLLQLNNLSTYGITIGGGGGVTTFGTGGILSTSGQNTIGDLTITGTLGINSQVSFSDLITAENGITSIDAANTFGNLSVSALSLTGTMDAANHPITNIGTPATSTDAVSIGYLSNKNSVIVATTTAGTLSTSFANGSVVNGVTLATGNRILIKDQSNSVENGIYTVNASGAPTRTIDFTTGSHQAGAIVFAEQGSSGSGTGYICSSISGSDLIGTDTVAFTAISGGGGGGGGGSISSIAISAPSFLTVSNSPLTSSGTISLSYSGTAIPVTSGGTGVTTKTGTGSVVLSTSPTLVTPVIGAATGTSLSVTGQLTSTVSTGTAPLVVSSTTVVPNLNASLLGGATFAAPSSIGSGTPSTGTFTTLTSNNCVINGSTSGAITAKAISGTYDFTFPTTSGSSGQVLTSSGNSGPMTWSDSGTGSVTSVAVSVPSFLSVSGSPITNSGTISISYSGTALPVTSGGTGVTTSTGTGSVVLSTSPTLVTPVIGAATGSSLSVSGQLTSTVSTGTAPLVVSSTTVVSNLNASLLGGATFASPGSIGSGTPGSGSFTTGSFSSTINMNNHLINNVATPVSSTDAATKGYVDSVAQGLSPKNSVIAATTTSGTLSTSFANGSVIDGVTLVTGQRILIKNQVTSTENGIYTVNASGSPTRTTDFAIGGSVAGAYTFVEQGTVNSNSGYICTSVSGSDIVGTNNVIFTLFSGAGEFSAGTGLTKTGTTFSVNASQTQITSVGTLGTLSVTGSATIKGVEFSPNSGDILKQLTFTGANNVSTPASITGLAFSVSTVSSFCAYVYVKVLATTNYYQQYILNGVYAIDSSTWYLTTSSTGNDSGVEFSITSAGQIQYISPNFAGFTSLGFVFKATTIAV